MPDIRPFVLRLPVALYAELQREAEAERRSMNSLIVGKLTKDLPATEAAPERSPEQRGLTVCRKCKAALTNGKCTWVPCVLYGAKQDGGAK